MKRKKSNLNDYSTQAAVLKPPGQNSEDLLAKHYRFTSAQRDAQMKSMAAAQSEKVHRRDQSMPMLRSERFRITTDQPPYGGINARNNEISALVGSSNAK